LMCTGETSRLKMPVFWHRTKKGLEAMATWVSKATMAIMDRK